jgi:hypothetical protein
MEVMEVMAVMEVMEVIVEVAMATGLLFNKQYSIRNRRLKATLPQ